VDQAIAEDQLRQFNAGLERQVEERTQELKRKVAELDREVDERRQVEQAVRKSEVHYRALFDQVPDGILIADQESHYLDANASICRMLGYPHDELVGLHASDIVTPAEIPHIEPALAAIRSQPGYHREWTFRRRDGSEFQAEVSVATMPDGHLLAVIHDQTERRQAEQERQHLQNQLQQAQKMESLGSLAGGIAHDMNNVLGAILGLASVQVRLQPSGSLARKAFETILQAAERGGTMVKSLLSFSRQSPAEMRNLDLNMVLREEIQLLEHTTFSKVSLKLDLEPGLRPICGDASALTHAVMNLCVNAVDAMPDQGTLTLRTRNVEQDWIEVDVEDNGQGMTREVLERALDPYFTTKAFGKGTGLGLPMAFRVVKAHQGNLDIQSEPGRGTRVRLRFPALTDAAPVMAAEAIPEDAPSSRPLRVLLVDDDELIRDSAISILELLGHAVTSTSSGEEALAQLMSGYEADVVILDMNMPGLGGKGTLPRLRKLCPTLPVVLATGRPDQGALDLIEAHPRVVLMPKPFSLKQLQHHLGQLLQGQ
jgi:PAS domain S-box-containing protein